MADNPNIQEAKPPEPPPKPAEVPKPTEQSNRSETEDQRPPPESQQSAQQEARAAAQSEHAKATHDREPNDPRPTPDFQAGLDEHTAARSERNGAAQEEGRALRPSSRLPWVRSRRRCKPPSAGDIWSCSSRAKTRHLPYAIRIKAAHMMSTGHGSRNT